MANELKAKSAVENIGDFFSAHIPAVAPEASGVATSLLAYANSGYELILGEAGNTAGLLLKGDGAEFSDAIGKILLERGATGKLRKALAELARAVEYKNGYCKLEWPGQGNAVGSPAKLSVYYRRRFPIEDADRFLAAQGVSDKIRERLMLYAELLQKPGVHFLALSAEEGKPLTWKTYFTQWVDRVSYATVLRRILSLLEMQNISPDTAGLLLSVHPQLLPYGLDRTLFVSLSFTETKIIPEVKLDYENLTPESVVNLVAPQRRGEELARIRALIERTGADNLSYLGVRLRQEPGLQLKYYSDSLGF